MNRDGLVAELVGCGYIKSEAVKKAFLKVKREEFLTDGRRGMAYIDEPLPILSGQTISAPSMIAIMLEVAELKPGMKVLEIGAGSGYNAALIAEIVGQENVFTVERIPELVAFASRNLEKSGYRVKVVKCDGSLGWKESAPYDRIIVTAAAPKISKHWVEQLKTGGLVIVPVGSRGIYQELVVAKKNKDCSVTEKYHGGCAFVPLIGEEGWPD